MSTSHPATARREARVSLHAALVVAVFLASAAGLAPRVHAAGFPTMSRAWIDDEGQGWFVGSPAEGPPSTGIEFVVGATTNGGTDWTLTYGPPNGLAGELFFVNDSVGWATHGWVFGTRLLTTRDGGLSWAVQFDSPNSWLTNIYFADASVGWLTRSSEFTNTTSLLRTVDGGSAWETTISVEGGAVSFLGQTHAWTATRRPHGIYATVDGGETWTRTETPDTQFEFLHFVSTEVGWAGTHENGQAVLYRSTNAGASWAALPTPDVGSLYTLGSRSDFLSETDIWIVRRPENDPTRNELIATEDGGETWQVRYETDARINDIHRVDRDTAWLAGETLVQTTDAGRTWHEISLAIGPGATAVSPRNRRVSAWAAIKRSITRSTGD